MEPCDLDALEARRLIGSKALSPKELVASCIRRIETVDPAVNAMVARDFDRAAAAAAVAEAAVMHGDPLGALHGLPIGIKDLEDTEGLRSTYGSVLFKDHVPTKDHLIVQSVKQAGAIVLGKTNTPEWGAGANTRNAVYGEPLRAGQIRRRFLRWFGRCAGDRHGAACDRLGHRRITPQSRRLQWHRRFPPFAGRRAK